MKIRYFRASTSEEREKWLQALTKVILEIKAKETRKQKEVRNKTHKLQLQQILTELLPNSSSK